MIYIDYTVFNRLLADVELVSNEEMYISERGWQDWMNSFSMDEVSKILKTIYHIGTTDTKEIRKIIGLSRAEASRQYMIPLRTWEDWESGRNKINSHYRSLLFYSFFLRIINKEESDAES